MFAGRGNFAMVDDCFEDNTDATCSSGDKMYIRLVFPGAPKAVQSFRFASFGKYVRKYQPKDTVDWKNYLKILALQQLPPGFSPLKDIALNLNVLFIFPLPKSARKRDIKALEEGKFIPHIKRPDLTDNLMKGLCDALTGTVWSDDSIVSSVQTAKCYGLTPKIVLSISECNDDSYLGNTSTDAIFHSGNAKINVDEIPF